MLYLLFFLRYLIKILYFFKQTVLVYGHYDMISYGESHQYSWRYRQWLWPLITHYPPRVLHALISLSTICHISTSSGLLVSTFRTTTSTFVQMKTGPRKSTATTAIPTTWLSTASFATSMSSSTTVPILSIANVHILFLSNSIFLTSVCRHVSSILTVLVAN